MENLSTEMKCYLAAILSIFIPSFALRIAPISTQISMDRPVWMEEEFELS
ncbi:MAG: hypothetical protein QE271_11345 [Bacteriovoracaceae bacterium]|nr:hypothetical protein [Bacteriovoracaceae bacterium]